MAAALAGSCSHRRQPRRVRSNARGKDRGESQQNAPFDVLPMPHGMQQYWRLRKRNPLRFGAIAARGIP
jgi:hypothetical protein